MDVGKLLRLHEQDYGSITNVQIRSSLTEDIKLILFAVEMILFVQLEINIPEDLAE